jgi:hypothetical protein
VKEALIKVLGLGISKSILASIELSFLSESLVDTVLVDGVPIPSILDTLGSNGFMISGVPVAVRLLLHCECKLFLLIGA